VVVLNVDNMEGKFFIKAAEHFLCPTDKINIEQMISSLYLTYEHNPHEQPNEDVILWEPFEGYTVGYIIDVIEHLASVFKKIHNEATK